ncbi:hypothetical protein HMPREF0580_0694 [Mobiluncus mulieris ATCC 35239]|uniref:Uncharacterized protein n=1 Tax=Mobiluncus mulieris ATCC 35239 TaxID=871571 RepID=E0QP80_9ACTO|nr:hypothetical protein HMPREF0580_0694 [Mobiluncus mulieris ATCC 35239]
MRLTPRGAAPRVFAGAKTFTPPSPAFASHIAAPLLHRLR